MIEILRRIGLLAGLLGGLWLYYLTPPALLRVDTVDFAARYDQEYRQRRGTAPGPGVMEQGRALIAELTDQGSVEAYVARTLENRVMRVDGAAWEAAFRPLGRGGTVFLQATDAPFAALVPELIRRRGASGWTNTFLALGNGNSTRYLEVTYLDEPATVADAPAGLVHPRRGSAWMWMLGGCAIYALLPWRRRTPTRVTMDPVSAVLALDGMGTLIAVVFFAIPLAIAGSTALAIGEDLGVTLPLWALSLLGVGFTAWAARNAARAIVIEPEGLRITSLTGAATFAFGGIRAVRPLEVRAMPRAGVLVEMQDGRTLRLPWRDFLAFRRVLDALDARGRGLARAPEGEADEPAPSRTDGRRRLGGRTALAIAGVAVALAALAWVFLPLEPEPPARDYEAEHQQSLLRTFRAAVASPATTTTLNLDGAKLARLPDGIETLTALRTLTLNRATGLDLQAVLAQLAALPALERLELAECGLTDLPAEIGGLTRLTSLLVWGNDLTTLPPEIGRLTSLDWINLHQNRIRTLPEEMAALTALTSLDLGQNGLQEVPPVVCRLTSLTSLDLSRNVDLPAIPACLGGLKRLEFLGLAFNMALRDLPAELAGLGALKELTGLEAGFLASPSLAALRTALPGATFPGAAEGALIDRMQEVTAEADRIQQEDEARRRRRLIR